MHAISQPAAFTVPLLLAPLLVLTAAGPLPAQPGDAQAQERLEEALAYHLKDGGIWRQENAEHEAGSGSPVAWVKRYRWGPGRTIVVDDTFALMEDGTCEQWGHNVFYWDAREEAVFVRLFHFSGARFSGSVRGTGDRRTAELEGTLPDGTSLTMRDSTDLSDPHEAVVTASFPEGDGWAERPPVSWHHVPGPERPCGL